MRRPVGEADHLVLDRRAIARADATDLAGVHRRAVEVGADDVVRAPFVCVMPQAICRVVIRSVRNENGTGGSSPCLHLEARPSRWCGRRAAPACPVLRRPMRDPSAVKPLRQGNGGRLADPARRDLRLAHVDQAAQERAGGQHHGAGR